MRTKSYPREKREIIAKYSFDQLMSFSKDVSPKLLDIFMKKLPSIQGFRKGTKELNMRLSRYFRRIEHWNDSDWSMFNDLWVDWINTYPKLNDALNGFDNDEDFLKEPKGTLPNSELDIKCFEFLSIKSLEIGVPRELVQQFYDYGYYIKDPLIERYITTSKSAAELELFELPSRIKKLEETCKDQKTNLELIKNKLKSSEVAINLEARFNQRFDIVETSLTEINRRFSYLEEAKNNLGEEIAQVQQKLIQIDSHYLEEEKRLLKHIQELFKKENSKIENDFSKQIKETKEELNYDLTVLTQKLNFSLSSLEHFKKSEKDNFDSNSYNHNKPQMLIQVKEDYLLEYDHFESLETLDRLLEKLIECLRNIGMQSVAAQVLANETLAALAVGQLVSFTGSIAPIVASEFAHCIAGQNVYRIRIPIGLINNTEFDEALGKVLSNSENKDYLCVLIIEGINLSAPEAYAYRLQKLITERFFSLNSEGQNLIVLATLVDGPSSLGIPHQLCEWGPIFHLDCFEWRVKWSPREVVPGFVKNEVWKKWVENYIEPMEDWEEVYIKFSSLAGGSTVLWQRALYLAATALNKKCDRQEFPSLIQSLIFGWVLPYAFSAGVDLTTLDKQLADLQIDATKKDNRQIKFLHFNRALRFF